MKTKEFKQPEKKEIVKKEQFSHFSLRNILEQCFKDDRKNIPDTHVKLKGYVSVSQITGDACLRKAYYQYIQEEKEDNVSFETHAILSFGTLIHEFIQSTLKRNNKIDLVEKFLQDDKLKICGSIDGIFTYKTHGVIDEIVLNDFKSCGLSTLERVMRSGKGSKNHIRQLHWYAYLLSQFYKKPITKLKLTYFCKNQSGYIPDMYYEKGNIDNTLSYLTEARDKMVELKRDVENINQHIYNLQSTLNAIKFKEENVRADGFVIHEIDFFFDQNIMDQEMEQLNYFMDIIKKNEQNLKEYNEKIEKGKKAKKPKERFPKRLATSKKYQCAGCAYFSKCRPDSNDSE